MQAQQPSEYRTAYIGFGGNLDHPAETIATARSVLANHEGIRELAFSSLYHSTPMGPADQPDYVNAVMAIATTLPPLALLDALQAVEQAHGRVRLGERWGPRTLDLDLLLYDQLQMNSDRLTIPHPGVAEREFVLYPLAEIAPPDFMIPGQGLLAERVRDCPRRGLRVLDDV